MASSDPAVFKEEEEDNAPAEDEDTGALIAPIVRLEEVAVLTGEEEEDSLLDMKAKLYRFDKDGKQWKERGVGTVKLLKHKDSSKVRLLMRQSKTLKICANHLVLPTMKMQLHAGNEKSCLWHAPDYADGELKDEMFCIRFSSVDNCKSFMKMFQEVAESKEKNKDVESTAEILDKLNVDGEEKGETKDEALVAANEKESVAEKNPEAAENQNASPPP